MTMLKNNLRNLKIFFVMVIFALIFLIYGGISFLKDNPYFTKLYIEKNLRYLDYRFSEQKIKVKPEQNNKAESVPVLLYHGVIKKPDGSNILLKDFKDQMFALKKAGWQTISVEDFYGFVKEEKDLPEKSFLLTFDDGRKDGYYPVDPILKFLDYQAVIFIITEQSLKNDKNNFHLSKNELKQMLKTKRWNIQAHTNSGHELYKIGEAGEKGHFYTNKLWLEDKNRLETEKEFTERIKSDLTAAKNKLEQELVIKVVSFAYPFGDFGQNSVNFPGSKPILQNTVKSIYPLSFYQVWPGQGFSSNYPVKDLFLFKRINVEPEWSAEDLLKKLETTGKKSLPYSDNFQKDNGWVKTWGGLLFKDDSMFLSSIPPTTGGSIFLEGSYLWDNYFLKAKTEIIKGESFSLMARYKNENNYVSCAFSPEFIEIERVIDGERKDLAKTNKEFSLKGNHELGIAVNGTTIKCYLDDRLVLLKNDLDASLMFGGIGFKAWDSKNNNSEVIIREIKVEEIK